MKKAFESAATLQRRDGIWNATPNSRPIITETDGGCKMQYTEKTEKEFYLKAISELMEKCNDIPLLSLIYKLLCKAF